MKFLLIIALFILPIVAYGERPFGSGRFVTGGEGKERYIWTFGRDRIDDLKNQLKRGNVYIELRGTGEIKVDQNYWMVGDNTTLDGTNGQITIRGPKGLYIQRRQNIVIRGICFKDNETAVNMSAGGDKVWVHKNTFIRSAWGSPVAFSGWNCDGKPFGHCDKQSTELTISHNKFGPSNYGPLMYLGVGEATFYRNHFYEVYTRIPRAQNQGTFHVCNNVFDAWHLGLQGDDGAKFIYENNVFNRATGHKALKDGRPLANSMYMNPKERIDVCWKDNAILGDQKNTELRDGPAGGIKFTCDFPRPDWANGCTKFHAPGKFSNIIRAGAGAGDWCRLD